MLLLLNINVKSIHDHVFNSRCLTEQQNFIRHETFVNNRSIELESSLAVLPYMQDTQMV